jgi:hypothetical protein
MKKELDDSCVGDTRKNVSRVNRDAREAAKKIIPDLFRNFKLRITLLITRD